MRQRQLSGVCGGRVTCPAQSQAHCQDNAAVRTCKDLVPSALVAQNRFQARAFCGRFSRGGDLLCVATQDRHMSVTNVENPHHWRPDRLFDLSAVGWAVIDCDMSPNDEFVVCSSWSSMLALCPLRSPSSSHDAPLCPRYFDVRNPANTAVFGVKFSPSGHELLLGCSNGYFVLFDAIRNQPVLRVRGHTKDINSVCFIDENVFATGGDDSLTQVWDRRVVGGWPDDSTSFESPSVYSKYKPVGGFLGHYEGVTSVASKGDGRYLISNSKDQSIKLWDCRKMACPGMLSKFREYRDRHCTFPFDYRWHRFKRTCGRMEADSSLVTFEGHTVQQTLIRCDFSPMATTGQQYVVSGSSDGCGYVFDVLSGHVVQRLEGHRGVVRDISWNPLRPIIVTTSWDNSCNRYEPRC